MCNTALAAMMYGMQIVIRDWLLSLRHYIYMCLLLSSPERLPYNLYCIGLTLAVYFVIGAFLVDPGRSYAVVCAQILLELFMLAGIAYLGLRWKNRLARFVQTYSALVGVNVIITAATIPIYRAGGIGAEDAHPLLAYAILAILVWNLAVLSLIFKRAFEISTHLSAMISFNYFVLYQFTVFWLY